VRIPSERPFSGDRSSCLAVNQVSKNKEVSRRVVQSHRAPPFCVVADGARSAEMAQPRAQRVGESCGCPQCGRHDEQRQLQRAVNAPPTGLRRCKSFRLDQPLLAVERRAMAIAPKFRVCGTKADVGPSYGSAGHAGNA
jgi:hypothetical protein